MSGFETNEMEIQKIRRKILNSDSNIKKKLINEDNLKEINEYSDDDYEERLLNCGE